MPNESGSADIGTATWQSERTCRNHRNRSIQTAGIEVWRRKHLHLQNNCLFCKPDTLLQPLRDDAIYHHFTGDNYRELALAYHLTEKTVRDIIDRQNAANMSGQMSLLQEEF